MSLQLSSSLLSRSVHAVSSPRLYLLWRLVRAVLAFARRDHWFFTSGGVVWGGGAGDGKVLMSLAMSFFAAIPWLVKAPPGLLPRGLFALEDALTFSDACWEETQQCPAWRRAQCVYMEQELNLRPRLSQIISLNPKKSLNFKVWPCRKLGSENYMLASSQQTVRAASVVFGGRRSTKESEQTSSSELTHTGDGKTSLFEKQHPPGGRACAQRTLQRLFCKAMVFPKCLVAKSLK